MSKEKSPENQGLKLRENIFIVRGRRNVWEKMEKSAVRTVRTIVKYADAVN